MFEKNLQGGIIAIYNTSGTAAATYKYDSWGNVIPAIIYREKGGHMKINARPLNEGETFVCSMKKAKEMFKNTDVHLNFAYYTRDYGTFAETQDRYFVKKNITGRVVASMYMHSGYKSPILSFYVIGKNNFCDELRVEFEQKYLPEFYKLYQTMLKDDGLIINTKLMLVEYVNNELKLHETVLDKK